jgi:formiminotetrahydrofolate cyclodeaminase
LVRAARPPAEVVGTADRVVALAEELLPFANPRLLSDVAAASDAARAAATTARLNVEINLAGVTDAAAREPLIAAAARTDAIAERADRLAATVRERIAR